MHSVSKEKAAGRAATAARISGQTQPYQPHAAPSRANTGDAVGAILIYLLGRPLPATESRVGWALAERWASELVDLKRGLIAGAA